MRKWLAMLATLATGLSFPVEAAIKVGAQAPDFSTQAALAGKAFDFTLSEALKKGPVVLYFYPKAFTPGCTLEAHEFAEATPEFAKLGATVIGMSADDIATLQKFSIEECRNKFAVAAASKAVIKAYDVVMPVMTDMSDRTSFVIAPDGKVIYAYSALSHKKHVANTLAAVRQWRASQKAAAKR